MYWTIARERKPKEKGLKWIWVTVDTPCGRAVALFTTEAKATDFAATLGGAWMTCKLDDRHVGNFVEGNMFTGDAQGRPVSHVVVDPDGRGGSARVQTLYDFGCVEQT